MPDGPETADETDIAWELGHGAVATITISRPRTKNGVTPGAWRRLVSVLNEIAVDDRVRVVVLRGSGGNFSSGGEMRIRNPEDPPPPPLRMMQNVNAACQALFEFPKATIAAVSGVAVGAGFNIVLACDLSVAEESARFSQIFVRRGMSQDFGGSWLLTRAVGLQRAKELVYFGDTLTAPQLHELGALNRVVPDGTAEAFALDWARELATRAPVTLANAKALLNAGAGSSFADAIAREASAQRVNVATRDTHEAVAAFVEKRAPDFLGY